MNKSNAMKKVFLRAPLALAVTALSVGTAQAIEFNFGDLRAQIDNNVSYGVSMRTESPDKGQIMPQNIGLAPGDPGFNDMGASYKDRKSTRLNSSHVRISYAVFCLKKKKQNNRCRW